MRTFAQIFGDYWGVSTRKCFRNIRVQYSRAQTNMFS